MLSRNEIPVAVSMLQMLHQPALHEYQPFQKFIFNWIAFNNIYTTLADQAGRRPEFKTDENGRPKAQLIHGRAVSKPVGPTEQQQIDIAFEQFSDELKHNLIFHESTRFFVYRTPRWHGKKIESDARGQRLNGVLNVGRTISEDYPNWTPIDTDLYEQYLRGENQDAIRNVLAKRIVQVLYTVRNNTFHGGKSHEESNDTKVLLQATPLLEMIVRFFVSESTMNTGASNRYPLRGIKAKYLKPTEPVEPDDWEALS